MARIRLYIPEEVKEKIREHLSERYLLATEGYFSASEDEDTLTGHLGATLKIRNQKVVTTEFNEFPGTWTWEIDYTKFRGRGKDATENLLGADGIIELTLKYGTRVEKKSILFQSKMNWQNDGNLFEQTIKLSTWREASFILNYTPFRFEAISIDEVIRSRGNRPNNLKYSILNNFLGFDFLNCDVGDTNLLYDAVSRRLIWRTINGQIVSTKFSIPHRIAIKIQAPMRTYGNDYKYDLEIPNGQIHNHRMDASEEDMLSLKASYSSTDIKKARKEKALIYHSDLNTLSSELLAELMKRRMQEFNIAHDYLKNKDAT